MKAVTDDRELPGDAEARPWTGRALFTVGFLGVAAGVQMADRGLQAILLSDIQRAFAVSDGAVGLLQGLAGILMGSAIAVPIARLGDRFARKHILLGLIAAWTVLVAASALAPGFLPFFAGRAAVGAVEFAMIPIVYSIIPDVAPERHRVFANLAFAALMAAGMSASFYYGDAIVSLARRLIPGAAEPWRKAYLLLATTGLPLFLLGLLTGDPPRRISPGDAASAGSMTAFLRRRWRPVLFFVGVAGALMVAVQALTALIALGLERRFGADLTVVGRSMGVIMLVTSVGCLPVAGALDRTLHRRYGARARPLIMGVASIAAVPCALLLPAADDVASAFMAVALFLFLTCTANALVPTILQDLAPAPVRARSFAVWSFVVSIFCAVGPGVAGFLSDYLDGRLIAAISITAVPALCLSALCALCWAFSKASPTTGPDAESARRGPGRPVAQKA